VTLDMTCQSCPSSLGKQCLEQLKNYKKCQKEKYDYA